jgi:uracil-DNA glycosylase family 4
VGYLHPCRVLPPVTEVMDTPLDIPSMLKMINGHGPLPSTIALIGQRPGKVELYRGKPFAGPSGDMLNDYLLTAGIDRSNCFVTNVVRTFEGDDEVTAAEIERDIPLLQQELRLCRPHHIGLLGRVAVDVMMPWVKDFDMYWGHGLMFGWQAPWGWCRLMPMYHPAAGMHQTSIQGATAWDFEQFGRMVRGELHRYLPDNMSAKTVYKEHALGPLDGSAVDTEGSTAHPWCLSWSNKAGTGYVARQPLKAVVKGIITHHMLHDWGVLKAMNITVEGFEDTMLKAALLGTEPMGLKDLARRHLGIRMTHYDELMREARRVTHINYLGRVVEWLNSQAAVHG